MSDRPVPETGERDLVYSVCRCGWESEPFPRAQLDTYDHFCADCEKPIGRWLPAGARQGEGSPQRPVVGEREERLREALSRFVKAAKKWSETNGMGWEDDANERDVALGWSEEWFAEVEVSNRDVLAARAALASSPSPPLLDGAECHELYSMWLAHHASEGVGPGHPLVTAGEKLAQRMDPGHPRFQAREDEQ